MEDFQRRKLMNFYDIYIKDFIPKIDIKKFNSFRLFCINFLSIVRFIFNFKQFSEYFRTEEERVQITNLMQISFHIWNDLSSDLRIINSSFHYFFLACCLIKLKVKFCIN